MANDQQHPMKTMRITLSQTILSILVAMTFLQLGSCFMQPQPMTMRRTNIDALVSRSPACQLQMLSIQDVKDKEIPEVTLFFVREFFGNGKELSPRQLDSLKKDQIVDFRLRYGEVVQRKLASSLLVAREDDGDLIGCIGIDVVACQGQNIGVKVPKGRSKERDSVEFKPVMSNLVIGKGFRKKGYAKKLVSAAEAKVKDEFGYDKMILLVDKSNLPAQKLYKKLGYKVLFENDSASKISISESGMVQSVASTNVCMQRDLNKAPPSKKDIWIEGGILFGIAWGAFEYWLFHH